MSFSFFTEPWDSYAYIVPTPNTIDLGIRWDMPPASYTTRVPGPSGGFASMWTPTGGSAKILGNSPSGWNVCFPLYFIGGNVHVRWLTGPAVNGTAINCSFDLLPNNYIGFFTGGLGGPLSAVSIKPLQYNKWHFIEFYCGGFWTCNTPANSYRVCLDNEIILSNAGGETTASPYIFPGPACYQGYADRMDFNFGGGVVNTTGLFNIWNGDACATGVTLQLAYTQTPDEAVCQE